MYWNIFSTNKNGYIVCKLSEWENGGTQKRYLKMHFKHFFTHSTFFLSVGLTLAKDSRHAGSHFGINIGQNHCLGS